MVQRKGLGWKSCGVGCVVVIVVLGALGAGYYSLVNRIPRPPQITYNLPNPNARDVYLTAQPHIPVDLPVYFRDIEKASEPRLEAMVRNGSRALKILRQGLPHECGTDPILSYQTLRPELKVYRDLVMLQLAEARLSERRGDVPLALEGYLNVFRVAAQVSNGPEVQDGNISNHIQKAALRGLERLIPHMSARQARKALLETKALEKQVLPFDETLRREGLANECRAIEVMWIARSGSPQAKADLSLGTVMFDYNPSFLLTPKERFIGAMRRHYASVRAMASEPYWERGPFPKEPDDPLNTMLLTPLEASIFARDATRACFQLVRVKLALRDYETSVRRAPSGIEDLTPRFISSVQDPFTGKPLRMKPDPDTGKTMVYSLGPDRDDDSGKPIKDAVRPDSDGDLTRVPDR